jgi:quinol monooxygenase YgiN
MLKFMFRYASKSALDEHMATEPVKQMISYMSSNPTALKSGPTIRQLAWSNDMHFTKPESAQQNDPLIVFAHLEFHAGKRGESFKNWQGNIKSSQDERGTFVYGIMEQDEAENDLFTLEVYESEDYLTNVHIPSTAVQETIKHTGAMRKNLTLTKLRLHGGFISR